MIESQDRKARYNLALQELVNILKTKYHIKTIEASNLYLEEIWTYKNGYYSKNGEAIIHSEIFFEDTIYERKDYNRVIDLIKGQTRITRDEIKNTKYECANFLNGVIHYSNKNIRFEPRKEDDYKYNFDYVFPIEYNPNAKCPEIDKIISEALETKEKIDTFYQFLGSCLLNDYRYKKAIVMVGVPGTAKTTLLNIAYQFIGSSNYCTISIDKIDSDKNRFTSVKLDGKRANICDEMTKVSPKNIDIFKASTGGGSFYVEEKGKSGYFITNNAKMLFAANELPSIDETIAESFFSRIVLLEFTKVFLNPNTNLKDKIYSREELSGLLNHALEGLKMLLDNDGYTQDQEEIPTIWNKYLIGGTILRDFVSQNIVITNKREDEITKSKMYIKYVEYKISKRETPISKKAFGIYFSTIPGVLSGLSSSNGIDGFQNKVWMGVEFIQKNLL